MAFGLNTVLDFIFQNIYIIAFIGVAGWFIYYLFRVRSTSKILNRSDIERLKFIERMKHNRIDKPMFLKKGKNTLGLITHFKQFPIEVPSNPDPKKKKLVVINQMIVRSMFLGKIPIGKPQAFQIGNSEMNIRGLVAEIKPHVFLDYYFGIYYDEETQPHHTQLIKNDNIMRTDLNSVASIYFVKSQEQSTYDPNFAHQMAMKEKELQIELARRRGKSESV